MEDVATYVQISKISICKWTYYVKVDEPSANDM